MLQKEEAKTSDDESRRQIEQELERAEREINKKKELVKFKESEASECEKKLKEKAAEKGLL